MHIYCLIDIYFYDAHLFENRTFLTTPASATNTNIYQNLSKGSRVEPEHDRRERCGPFDKS
jgi:hypothetical protein